MPHPHHIPIVVVISVGFSLALISTAVVLAGYFTNWFQGSAPETPADDANAGQSGSTGAGTTAGTTDLPSTILVTAVSSNDYVLKDNAAFTQTDAVSDVQFTTSGATYSADSMLMQWADDNAKISVLPNTTNINKQNDAYVWFYSNSLDNVSYYATSATLDIASVGGEWTTTSSLDATITLVSGDFPDAFMFGAVGVEQEMTRTDPPIADIPFSDDITYAADSILAQWVGAALSHVSLVANTDNDLAGDGAAYAWLYSNSESSVSYYTTSDTTDVFAVSGAWTSNMSTSDATVTITPSA